MHSLESSTIGKLPKEKEGNMKRKKILQYVIIAGPF